MTSKLMQIDKITVKRGGQTVLRHLSLSVNPGERVVIRGVNGAGKTTLLRACLGLLPLESGRIKFHGIEVGSREWLNMKRTAAWVPQERVLHNFPVSCREVVAVGLAGYKIKRRKIKEAVDSALRAVGVQHLADCSFHRVSGGERQKVSLARCIVQGADILLLDEPTSSLDGDSRLRLVTLTEQLSRSGRAVVVVTHEQSLFPPEHWREYNLAGGILC
ncbi:MAG: hypothetical protein B0D92_08735 [Spirochaeta sp. LUC14_002_19_P3]|nr:MAG: hypothetical protein B0D92_08735 [Spirochaeta sp. LUC14_002_19_P3]